MPMQQNQHEQRFEKLITDLSQKDHLDMALALQIAQHATDEMRQIAAEIKEEVSETRNEFRQANVSNLRRIISLEETVGTLKTELMTSRQSRADHEVAEAELRLQLAKATKAGLSTEEKLQVKDVVTASILQEDDKKNKERSSVWRKRLDTMFTAIMVSLGVSAAMGIVAFILWLVRMYLASK